MFPSHRVPPFPKYIGSKIQDSRSPKDFLNLRGRIQDSRFKIQDPKRLLESKGVGFKIQDPKKDVLNPRGTIQDSRFQKDFLNPRGRIPDSRFKIPKRLLESKGVGFKIQDSRSQKDFLNPRG